MYYVTDYSIVGHSVMRFDPFTGDFLGTFVSSRDGRISRIGGWTFGPGGDLFVSTGPDTFSSARVLRYSGTNGAFIGLFARSYAWAPLNQPFDLVFAPDGNLLIAELTSTGKVAILRYNGTNGNFMDTLIPATGGGLTSRINMVIGPDADLYVSTFSHNVLRFNATNGAFVTTFVSPGSGGLLRPGGLTFGPDGRLYVCSPGSSSILRYNGKTGAFIDTFIQFKAGDSGPWSLTFTPRLPKLAVARMGTSLRLKWPATYPNYDLEIRPSFAAPNSWVPHNEAPTLINDDLVISISPSNGSGFFRLRRR